MNRLTAEKARQILDAMDAGKGLLLLSIPGVDVRETIKQALQLALLVIEAQECADTFGSGFVVCQPYGTPAKVADPSKVRISFTDRGPGYAD